MQNNKEYISEAYVELGVKEKVGFGLGDMASNISFGAVALLLLYFYTNIYGLTPAQAGIIFFVGRTVDAIFNVVIGYFIDKTQTRWGKLRPYLLFGAVPLGCFTVLCFTAWDVEFKFYWALVSYTVYCMAYTAVNTPYGGLTNTLTQHSGSRASLSAYRMACASLGYLIVSLSIERLVGLFDDAKTGYTAAVALFALLATVLFFCCFFMTEERVKAEENAEKISLQQMLRIIYTNKPLIVLSLFTFFIYIGYMQWMAAGIYYVEHVMQRDKFISTFLFTQMAAQFAGTVVSDWLVPRMGKKHALIMSLIAMSAAMLVQYLFGQGQDMLIMVCISLYGFFLGIVFVCMFAMVADTVEYSEYHQGIRAEGTIFGFFNFMTKVAMAVAGGLSGLILEWSNYSVDNVVPSAVGAIDMMMTLIPAVLFVVSLGCALMYSLDEKSWLSLLKAIEKRKNKEVPGMANS